MLEVGMRKNQYTINLSWWVSDQKEQEQVRISRTTNSVFIFSV